MRGFWGVVAFPVGVFAVHKGTSKPLVDTH